MSCPNCDSNNYEVVDSWDEVYDEYDTIEVTVYNCSECGYEWEDRY